MSRTRSEIGDDLVPDYFTRIEQDDFYGWPYAYMSPNLTDPRLRLSNGSSERPDLVNITRTPDVLFQAHSAVLDTLFYTGNQFPAKVSQRCICSIPWIMEQRQRHWDTTLSLFRLIALLIDHWVTMKNL